MQSSYTDVVYIMHILILLIKFLYNIVANWIYDVMFWVKRRDIRLFLFFIEGVMQYSFISTCARLRVMFCSTTFMSSSDTSGAFANEYFYEINVFIFFLLKVGFSRLRPCLKILFFHLKKKTERINSRYFFVPLLISR